MTDVKLMLEQLERLAIVLDELMPGCAELVRNAITILKRQEPIKPTINEYGEAYCICGENVGIIPNSKNLPKICSKYCSECGRRMKWE